MYAPRTWLSVASALLDHGAILAIATGVVLAHQSFSFPLSIPLYLLGALLIARSQRGLENLVHEASHKNWYRKSGSLNDLLANLLAALPVFSMVEPYRRQHMVHHRQFGSEKDMDLRRYRQLDIHRLKRGGWAAFTAGMAVRIGGYLRGWWQAIGLAPSLVIGGLAWHAVVLLLPLSLLLGPGRALGLWGVFWIGPFLLVLPWLRFTAETAKHRYVGHDNEFDATISNVGWAHRLFLHPHNDGYHGLHHLFPAIPHHRLRQAHRLLADLDPGGYGSRLPRRRRVLEEPGSQEMSPRS